MPLKRATSKTNEFHFKIILLGECETGKTALMRQICDDQYSATYKPTIGVDNGVYSGELEQGRFRIIFYDTSGQERFRPMTNALFSSSQAAIFVYDMKNPETLEKLEPLIKEVCERKDAANFQKILLGNKNDLIDSNVATKEKAFEIAKQYRMRRIECSAKVKPSVMKAISDIVGDLIAARLKSTEDAPEKCIKNEPKQSKDTKKPPLQASHQARTISESTQSESVSTNEKDEIDPQSIDIFTENRKSIKKIGCACMIF